MSSKFQEYLDSLTAETSIDAPPESHASGLGLVVWTLWSIMRGGQAASQIQAAKELIDRSYGKAVQTDREAVSTRQELYKQLLLHKLTPDQSEQLRNLLDLVDPDE